MHHKNVMTTLVYLDLDEKFKDFMLQTATKGDSDANEENQQHN